MANNYDINANYRVIFYGRYSSKRQRDTSIEQQFDELRTLIKKLKLPWNVVGEYADRGVSGRKTSRKQLLKMQNDLRAGLVKADLVLVTDLDRLSRAKRGGGIRATLETLGVAVTTSTSGFADPTSSEAELMANVNEFRANKENVLKGVRVRWAKGHLAKQGFWPGGPAPLGLLLKPVKTGPDQWNSKLVENPETGWIVKRMFEISHEQAVGPQLVARAVNADPNVAKLIGDVGESQVRSVLRNPIYIGTLRYNLSSTEVVGDSYVRTKNHDDEVVIVEDMCEPLVDLSVWQAVQDQFAARSTGARCGESRGLITTRHRVPLKRCLAGLAVCADCGAAMHGSRSGKYKAADGSSRRYCYYNCPRRRSGCCGNDRPVPADWLEEYVVNTLLAELFGIDDVETGGHMSLDRDALLGCGVLDELCREIQAAIESMVDEGLDPRAVLEAEREQLLDRKVGFLKSLGNADLDEGVREAICKEMASAIKRLKEIEGELATHAARDETFRTVVDRERVASQLLDFHRVIATRSASAINVLLHQHVDRVECHRDGRVQVVWTRLGLMGGREIEAFLAWFTDDEKAEGDDHTRPEDWIKPRRRAPRNIGMEIEDLEEAQAANEFAINPYRFEGLDSRWFVVTETTVPETKCWAEEHAIAIADYRLANHATEEKTAIHFGVSIPTIRKGLRIARDEHGSDATGKWVSRPNRACWARDNANAVLQFVEATAATLTAAAKHFGKSQPTISKALKLARADRESSNDDDSSTNVKVA